MEIKCQLATLKCFSCQGEYLLKTESVWKGVESGRIVSAGVKETSADSNQRRWEWAALKESGYLAGWWWVGGEMLKAVPKEEISVVSLFLPLLLFQSDGSTFCRTGSVCLTTAGSAAQGRTSTVWLNPCTFHFEETSKTRCVLVSPVLKVIVVSSVLSTLSWYKDLKAKKDLTVIIMPE